MSVIRLWQQEATDTVVSSVSRSFFAICVWGGGSWTVGTYSIADWHAVWVCERTVESGDNLTHWGREGSFKLFKRPFPGFFNNFNPLNAALNPICYLLALLAYHFLHVSRIRVKSLTLRLLMSYIYIHGAPILDVSRSHTTTQHSR